MIDYGMFWHFKQSGVHSLLHNTIFYILLILQDMFRTACKFDACSYCIAITKCPLSFLVNFAITSGKENRK